MRFPVRLGVVLLAVATLVVGGMAVSPTRAAALELQSHPTCTGFYYTVMPGDNLYRIALHYNTTVMHYITGIQSLPWVLVSRPLGFHEKEFFSAEGDTATPQVSFTPTP